MSSKNLVSIRILNYIGTTYAQDYVTKFRLRCRQDSRPICRWRSAPGSSRRCSWRGAYSVFANGGYRINPYLIADVADARGTVVSRPQPLAASRQRAATIQPRNAYMMNSLLHTWRNAAPARAPMS